MRDWETITHRSKYEGLSFLTITLPTFCKGFERSLDIGKVDPAFFPSFKVRGGLPEFLRGFLGQIFDRSSGLLLDEPSVTAIFFVRQITLMFKKIEIDCSKRRVDVAFRNYIKCEQDVESWTKNVSSELIARFDNACGLLWGPTLSDIDRKVYEGHLEPYHGPGSTADRILGNQKFDFRSWTERLEEYFPSSEFCIPNWGFYDSLSSIDILEPGREPPVRVVTVPKTLKTPRIIAMEPVHMQYVQQGIMRLLVDALEKNDFLSDAIGFTDQTPNQRMAREASRTKRLATLDLSEASDRVSNLLVERLFLPFRTLAGAIQACRSTTADVPGHGIIPLSKFASMGSATCFPVEAMVFLTIVFGAWLKTLSSTPSRGRIQRFLESVRVYGDDIIVPVDLVRHVVEDLNLFGLKVNHDKSFWTGKFRESCGGDFYDGHDVRPTYVRSMLPTQRGDVQEIVSTFSLRNQLYKSGMWRTVRHLDSLLERFAPLPAVSETSPALGRHTFLPVKGEKMCEKLHRPLVKAYKVVSRPPISPITGVGALLKFFLKRGRDPYFESKHLERYGRPRSVDIKIAWVPVH
jgi:hypothetical protein